MHSSRMRTGRSLTYAGRGLLTGVGGSPYWGGGLLVGEGDGSPLGGASFPGGSPCQGEGVSFQGGLLAGGSHCWGTSFPGGSPCQGVPPSRGSPCQGVPPFWGSPYRGSPYRETHPPVDRITDTSKNITLTTTSLRPVTRMHSSRMHTICCSDCGGVCVCHGVSA